MDILKSYSCGTLVVPMFNEQDRFAPKYWLEVAQATALDLHFVDDGSSDRTPEILDDFVRTHGFTVTHLVSNVGKANALREGFLQTLSKSTITPIGFVDADAVFTPDDIEKLNSLMSQKELRSFDAFFSSRVALSGRTIHRRGFRHYIGRAIATLLSTSYSPMPYDSQSGLKFFRRSDTLVQVLQSPFDTRWFFEMELLIRWRHETGHPMAVWEEPVHSWFDAPGSKIRGRQALRVTKDLYSVIVQARRSAGDTT